MASDLSNLLGPIFRESVPHQVAGSFLSQIPNHRRLSDHCLLAKQLGHFEYFPWVCFVQIFGELCKAQLLANCWFKRISFISFGMFFQLTTPQI